MFRFRRRVLEQLDTIDIELVGLRVQADKTNRYLRIIMGNQEILDEYAAKIGEQNTQIRNAFAVIVAEIANLREAASAVDVPLDTTNIDAAVEQLTAAVDAVESIPAPAVKPE